MAKMISKNLDINKLTERMNLPNGTKQEEPKRWFYKLWD